MLSASGQLKMFGEIATILAAMPAEAFQAPRYGPPPDKFCALGVLAATWEPLPKRPPRRLEREAWNFVLWLWSKRWWTTQNS